MKWLIPGGRRRYGRQPLMTAPAIAVTSENIARCGVVLVSPLVLSPRIAIISGNSSQITTTEGGLTYAHTRSTASPLYHHRNMSAGTLDGSLGTESLGNIPVRRYDLNDYISTKVPDWY